VLHAPAVLTVGRLSQFRPTVQTAAIAQLAAGEAVAIQRKVLPSVP
jgi:hypothetical protein